jgi:hypothetical protein
MKGEENNVFELITIFNFFFIRSKLVL